MSLFELESIQRLAIDLANEMGGSDGRRALGEADKERVEDAMGIMVERFREDLGMGEIARQVGVSERQFYRLFKRYHGCGPREFLEEVRLRSGREILLRRPDCLVKQVAFEVGFRSEGYFSKRFRKRFGCAPGELLRRQAEGLA